MPLRKIILIIILILGFFSCTSKEEIAELEETKEVVSFPISKSEELLLSSEIEMREITPISYTYYSYGKRDPFVPLTQEEMFTAEMTEEKEKEKKVVLNLKDVYLIGIIKDKKNGMALLCDRKENGYILKQGLLYDDIGNKLEGIEGMIKEDYVTLKQNEKSYTITLSNYIEKEEKSSESLQSNKQESSSEEEF